MISFSFSRQQEYFNKNKPLDVVLILLPACLNRTNEWAKCDSEVEISIELW